MDAASLAIDATLWGLTLILVYLTARNLQSYFRAQDRSILQLMWALGLALAAAAMAIEAVIYVGVIGTLTLQTYEFLTAALVGVLSLGATRVLKSPRLEAGYRVYTIVAIAVVGVACYLLPAPTSMVVDGVITNVPVNIDIVSALVTGPATVVLIVSGIVSLLKTKRWQNSLMIAGAFVLGAGGAFYVASFPIVLYYAEFVGILLLFFGLINMPKVPVVAPTATPAATSAP